MPEDKVVTEASQAEESTPMEATKVTDLPSVNEQDIVLSENTQEPTEASITPMIPSNEEKSTTSPLAEELDKTPIVDSRRTTQNINYSTTPKLVDEEERTESAISEQMTHQDKIEVTESPTSQQNTVPISTEDEHSSEAPQSELTTTSVESNIPELPSTEQVVELAKPIGDESSKPSISVQPTTSRSDTEEPVKPEDMPTDESTTVISKEEETVITTEPTFKKEEEVSTIGEGVADKEHEQSTLASVDITKESGDPSDKATSTERIFTSEPEVPELKPATVQLPEQQEHETTSLKEATTESIMELSTFAHGDKESFTTSIPEKETVATIAATEKIDLSDITTINPADNEIAEVPSPGRIPGEGDCLLEGTTYKNDSIVPSTNKCHSGCKCVSSIIKCNPIICSPPPEDMDNCQPRYDTPEACCPTYICDHGMETIPPQPQSHITGTESPTLSTIECHGDICEKIDNSQPSAEPPQTPGTVETSECGSSDCDQAAQTPTDSCAGGKCGIPQAPTEAEQTHETPTEGLPQSCANPEDCKDVKIPSPCEGESCTASQSDQCDDEHGCVVKPDAVPQQETPQVCTSEEECKQAKIPQAEAAPCEGESCTNVQGDCSGDECKIIPSSQPSQDGEICSEEGGCKKPGESVQCENGKCPEKEIIRTECSGEECMQQQPISPTQETSYSGPVSTVSPSIEETTSRQPTAEEESEPAATVLPSTSPEDKVTVEPTATVEPDKEMQEPESPLEPEKEQVTEVPEEIMTSLAPEVTSEQSISEDAEQKTTKSSPEESTSQTQLDFTTIATKTQETESPEISATEPPPQAEEEAKPDKEQSQEVTESQDVQTDKPKEILEKEPEKSTEMTQQQFDDTKPSESPDTPLMEEGTKAPEIEQELIPVSPEMETTKPEDLLNKTPGPEIVTMKVSEESTTSSDVSEISTESGTKATAPSVQETEEPKLSTVSDELETQTDVPSKSPALQDENITTPVYEKGTPEVYVTEPQEVITEIPKEDVEKMTTYIPERSGAEDQFETTVRPSDITQIDTLQPETDGKDSTTDVPKQEDTPRPYVESQTTLSPEIATPSEQAEPEKPVSLDDSDKVTEMPGISAVEKENETESPLSLVTTQPQQVDVSTKLEIAQTEEIPEPTTPTSQLHEIEDEFKTQAPETHVPTETASPLDIEKTEAPQHPVTEQESITERLSTEKSDLEPAIEQQEPEVPVSISVETEAPVSQAEEHPITRTPPVSETEATVFEQVTSSQEPETTEVQDKTTQAPIHVIIPEKDSEKDTSHEPTITEEYETSTGEPGTVVDEEQHVTVTEETPMQTQETITKEPELHLTETVKPTESSEKEKTPTEKPLSDVEKDVTETPETIASIEPELPVPVTEGLEIPEKAAEDKDTTEIPLSEHEITQTPELHETAQFEIVDKLTTIVPEVVQTEPQEPTTEKPADEDKETKLPEQEPAQGHEKEQTTATNVPILPVEEAQTELPELSAATQPEQVTSVISEGSTTSPNIQEKEQTDRPEPATESSEIMKGSDRTGQEQTSTESVREELPVSTTASLEASTMIPVLEEDKQKLPEEPSQTVRPEVDHSETTPYLVELEEHTHKMDEEVATIVPSDESPAAPSEEQTEPPSGEPSAGPSEISTPSEEPVTDLTEKSTASPLDETTVISLEEHLSQPEKPSVVSSEEPAISSTEKPSVALPEEPAVITTEQPAVELTEEPTTSKSEMHGTEPQIRESTTEKLPSAEQHPELPDVETERPSDQKEEIPAVTEEPHATVSLEEATEKTTDEAPVETTSEFVKPADTLVDKFGKPEEEDKEKEASTSYPKLDEDITLSPSVETDKPASVEETEKDVTVQPQNVPVETTAPEEEFIPVTAKTTTAKADEEAFTQAPATTAEQKPLELPPSTSAPEIPKPDELLPTDEVPSPEEESHFPPSGGYNQEPDYVEEDQAFGPGTCRYGGKVYVSAQQIPRDDPCDFCFCFRSDIICLQQSCPPPIHGCHEEPIQGFCCPRYECPVSMATTLNVTTTTTTTTTTLPPHFLPHAYKGAATRKGCQIKGHTYQVGEVVRASSGPCLHCTCGGDGQMKCDPKQCTPEPMLRQMIAAAVSAKRRR